MTVLRSAVVRFQGLAFDSIAKISDALVGHKGSRGTQVWLGPLPPAVLSPPPPSWCPWRRTSPPSPVMAPATTTFPTVLPSLSAAVPATFLGIGNLAVSQRLGSSIDRRSVNCRYGEDDESRRTKRRENVAHPSNSSRPKVGRQEYLGTSRVARPIVSIRLGPQLQPL